MFIRVFLLFPRVTRNLFFCWQAKRKKREEAANAKILEAEKRLKVSVPAFRWPNLRAGDPIGLPVSERLRRNHTTDRECGADKADEQQGSSKHQPATSQLKCCWFA